MRLIRTIRTTAVAALVAVGYLAPAVGQERGVSLIRDAETECIIRGYAAPIFSAAGLDPSSVTIHLVNDDALNAFVAGGQRLFIHTGLLMRTQHPGQVTGVIAHEAGHIAGAHLVRVQDALRSASAQSIAAFVLGAAAALATGDGRAAAAVIAGGQQAAVNGFLQYSRTQESAADAAALKYLDATGQSARGLLEFLEILADQNLLAVGGPSPYLSTHPLTADRINGVAGHLALSAYANVPDPPLQVEQQARIRAKLIGFLRPFDSAMRAYPESDVSVAGRYARAVALFRRARLDEALVLIDGLLAEEPRNPYFHEIKGQMLFENGRVAEALGPYAMAVQLAPDEALLRTDLARVQLELNDSALMPEATAHLEQALRDDPDLGGAWRQLVIAYGRAGAIGQMALAQAELALRRGDRETARAQADRAEAILPRGSPSWIRAQDIRQQVDR